MASKRWVWLRQPMIFHNNQEREWFTIPAWTKGYLVKPNEEQRAAMARYQERDQVRIYLVHVMDLDRYIGIDKLMMEDEWNERRKQLQSDGLLPQDK